MRNQMFSALLLFITAALFCGMLEGMDSIQGNCNDVIRLPCKATERTNNYRYIIWYKIITQKDKIPIIKKKGNQTTQYKNYINSTSLGEKETLELRSTNTSDSGEYECYLAADVGGRNEESFIKLNILECIYLSTLSPSTVPAVSCPAEVKLSVSWALLGFSLISVTKIMLCIVAVGICDRVIFKRVQKKTGQERDQYDETDKKLKG